VHVNQPIVPTSQQQTTDAEMGGKFKSPTDAGILVRPAGARVLVSIVKFDGSIVLIVACKNNLTIGILLIPLVLFSFRGQH
jgi:hypothetical protein